MHSPSDTIQLLKKIILDENCNRMNKSVVLGYLGELIVLQKFNDEGYSPVHKGKLSGYDILVRDKKIEVKTSRLKEDGFKNKNWGWTLLKKNQDVKYDIAVCLALNEKLEVEGYYCIDKENLESFKFSHGQYTNITKGFLKFQNLPKETDSEKIRVAYDRSVNLMNSGKMIVIAPNETLGQILQ